jgi:hypothetical protein
MMAEGGIQAPAPIASPRAVLDSSVLVPAWSRQLLATLAKAQPPLYRPIWCEWIIAETWRVLTAQYLRRRAVITLADERQLSTVANAMLLALLPAMELISVVPPFLASWPAATDANDQPIWTAAVKAGASFVISHNVRDFPPRDMTGHCVYRGIEFITTENFVCDVLGLEMEEVAPVPIPTHGRVRHLRHAP